MLYNICLGIACLAAFLFIFLVIATGKGDAMSGGGGSVRTSFHGKASFDDFISRLTLILYGSFMGLMILLNYLS